MAKIHLKPSLKKRGAEHTAASKEGRREVLSIAELMLEAGVSRRFLELEINRGRLRKIQLSTRLVRVRRADWERYLESSAS